MQVTEESTYMSQPIANRMNVPFDTNVLITRDYRRDDVAREKWQQIIDFKLIDWGTNRDQLDDEGIDPPNNEVISLAIKTAQAFCFRGWAPPDSVALDPNGGIVFERREQDVVEVFHIWDDCTIEYQCFQGKELITRYPL